MPRFTTHITGSNRVTNRIKFAAHAAALLAMSPFAGAATFTWDGGGSDGLISNATNWNPDGAPTATGNNLVFAGTTNLTVNNDIITALATATAGSITFDSTAGSFNIGGNEMTMGSGGGGGLVILQQNSANAQTISANIKLSGGNGDRSIVFGGGAGSLTLSGNINFNGDWLFPTTTAGTIVLSGTNTGDGKTTAAVTAGTNTMRAMMRNNVAGTTLVLGSDSALGNSGSGDASLGTAAFRGIIANQQLNLNSTGNRNLSGSSLAINASNITYNSTSNLSIGNLLVVSGNRDFLVSNSGTVTVGNIFLSTDTTGRNLYANMTGTGGMIVNGKLFDTFNSTLTTTASGTFRKAGTGMITLNGDSSTFNGLITIEAGTLKIGHNNALGAFGASSNWTTMTGNATLDLNGCTTPETININNNGNNIINSNTSAAAITSDVAVNAPFTINATGDITFTRLVAGLARTVTKLGAGTVTTSGTNHNNLIGWDIQNGTVVFANTAGYGADRGVAISNNATLKLSGANSDLINNNQAFTMNTGTFDLNGKAEAVSIITGTGVVNNNGAAAGTIFMGGGSTGTTSGTTAVTYQDGSNVLNVTKEGTGTITISGNNTYTGASNVNGGVLMIGHANALGSSANPATDFTNINAGVLDLNGFSIAEKLWANNAAAKLINSSTTAASVTTDIGLSSNLTIDTTGDITATRLIAGATRTVTKVGAGSLTTTGPGHNNLTAWDIQAGTVVFANTSGYGSDRGTTLNGGLLKLSGSNSDLINNSSDFTINTGTFDLNGKSEAVASIGGTGGDVTNNAGSTSTLFVGGGTAGTSTASYAGVIHDGVGAINVTKEGTGTQTFTGVNTYTGSTTVKNGKIITNVALKNNAPVILQTGGVLEIPLGGSATGVSAISSLSTADTGSHIELHDNDLVVNYGVNPSSYTSIVNQVKSGLALLGGTGTEGITSAEVDAQTVQGTMLAVVDDGDANIAGAITSTSGYTLASPTSSVIVKFTWFGDSNLDGVVDGSDYALLDSGFTSGGSLGGWVFGDYDYSGAVDGSDYALIDTGFISQNAVLPEPTTLGLLGLAAMSMLRRRRA